MDSTAIIDALSRALPGDAARFEAVASRDGMPTIYVAAEHLVETCRVLRDDPELRFVFLADITAVDYLPREPRFEVIYLLVCPGTSGFGTTPKRLRLKVRRGGRRAGCRRVSGVWPSANWAEREVYDLFGIVADGHPDLRRILMPEDWEGHPMRKDYPVQIKLPVKTYEPLQVSEEEFVANIEAARSRSREDGDSAGDDGRAAHDRARARRRDRAAPAGARGVARGGGASRGPDHGGVRAGGKVLVFGNGGSAADAQHLPRSWSAGSSATRRAGGVALTTDTAC